MKIKSGVDIKGIQPEIVVGLIVSNDVYRSATAEFRLTSALEGVHMVGSKHGIGQAIDIGIRDLSSDKVLNMFAALKLNLGEQFNVVLESDHIHIEFDPK